jgi:hypothetical protein
MDKRFEGLPTLMKDAIKTLKELHNTPDALAMPAVLGVANLAAMPHYRINSMLFGNIPISLYILCMLPTGMRKTTNYKEISVGIERYEKIRWDQLKNERLRYELDEKSFKKACARYVKDQEENGSFGTVPLPDPVRPIETTNYRIGKATLNGVIDQLKSQPFVGLSSSEAGEFFNSHSFQGGPNALSKAVEISAALTTMWDGGIITRQTGMDSTRLSNRAVNMMFFLQEETVREFLNNPMFSAQGFVHRILISQADITETEELDMSPEGKQRLEQIRLKLEPFHERIELVIGQRMKLHVDRTYELEPEILNFTQDACVVLQEFYNVNRDRSRTDLKYWAGFAERLLEHLMRIAGTLAAFDLAPIISMEHTLAAMDLMDYFIEQRLQLELGVSTRNANQKLAVGRLLDWIVKHEFTGTRRELNRRLRWFNELTNDERDEILESLVNDESIFVETVVAANHRTTVNFSWKPFDSSNI